MFSTINSKKVINMHMKFHLMSGGLAIAPASAFELFHQFAIIAALCIFSSFWLTIIGALEFNLCVIGNNLDREGPQ
jgi:hypothetical protein